MFASKALLQRALGILLLAAAGKATGVVCPLYMDGIAGSATGFCVDAYGHSADWAANPTQNFLSGTGADLLGQSGLYIAYTYNSKNYQEWLGPWMTGSSPFNVESPVTISHNQTFSEVADKGTGGGYALDITIASQVVGNEIKMSVSITNTAPDPITALTMAEYFQYFPYGQRNENAGVLSYEMVPAIENLYASGLWAGRGSSGSAGFIRGGGVCGGFGTGCSTPASYVIGNTGAVQAAVAGLAPGGGARLSNTGSGTAISSSVAGALAWNYTGPPVAQGGRTTFTLELVPEPGTWSLLAVSLGIMAWVRRRRDTRQ